MNNFFPRCSTLFSLGFFVGCSAPKYLPSAKEIDTNVYGSYIEADLIKQKDIAGELIALDSTHLVVLPIDQTQCEVIAISAVKGFTLRYAKSKNYAWTIPTFAVFSLVHGQLAAVSLPLNLIVTTSVTVSGRQAFLYDDKEISYTDLQMFARYPQGIPEGITLDQIKPHEVPSEIERGSKGQKQSDKPD